MLTVWKIVMPLSWLHFLCCIKKKKKKKKGRHKDDRNDSEVEALQAKNNETKITETSPEVEAL
jgi:hypothetical protein